MKKFIFPSLLLMVLAGCQDANNASYDLRKDKGAPNYMSYHASDLDHNGQVIGNDVTNQNPNFLKLDGTRNGMSSGGAGNYGTDIAMARQVIKDTHEFREDSIWINGDRMWVDVYKKGMRSDREKIKAEARLHRKLIQALPRYHIEVRVKEDRR